MASPFDEWSLEDARLAVALSGERAKQLDNYRKYLSGDMFNSWEGWTGPKPIESDANAQTMSEEIMRGFVSRNVLLFCVGTHINGILGRDVKFSVVPRRKLAKDEQPSAEEQAVIDEATVLLETWVEERKLNQEFDKVGKELLTAGIAYQRPFVAPGVLDENGVVPQADLATSLGRVYVQWPLAGEAVVWIDPRTQAKCGIYLYREVTSSRPSEAAGKEGPERAELCYLDGEQTIIRIVGGEANGETEFAYRLGGRVLLADMQRPPLIDEQVVSQQKLLNKTLSMMSRNMDMAGFRERVTYNAALDGEDKKVRNADGTERTVFVPDPLPKGPSVQTNLTGEQNINADGSRSFVTPGMDWIDPVPVTSFLATANSAYLAILADCNLLHYSMAGDAVASGVSRETAMAAYLTDLLQTKQQIDTAWSTLLETALALASTLSGVPGYFDKFRVAAECSVDPGPISVEMLRAAMELTGGQPLLSAKTARTWAGVEDVDAEQTQIDAEQSKAAATQGPDLAGVQDLLNRVRSGAVPANGEQPPVPVQNGADGQAQGAVGV